MKSLLSVNVPTTVSVTGSPLTVCAVKVEPTSRSLSLANFSSITASSAARLVSSSSEPSSQSRLST